MQESIVGSISNISPGKLYMSKRHEQFCGLNVIRNLFGYDIVSISGNDVQSLTHRSTVQEISNRMCNNEYNTETFGMDKCAMDAHGQPVIYDGVVGDRLQQL